MYQHVTSQSTGELCGYQGSDFVPIDFGDVAEAAGLGLILVRQLYRLFGERAGGVAGEVLVGPDLGRVEGVIAHSVDSR